MTQALYAHMNNKKIKIKKNKLENLEEMDKFLDTYNHPKLNQEDINHLNRSITNNKIETAIKSLKKRKAQDPVNSLLNSIRPLKKTY
jgi:NADH/NAD ratio-sensing transcriptional regulator Rex